MLSLPFPPQGPFKILQFTDLHLGNRPEKDEQTLCLVEEMALDQTPDLLVFTGDIFTKNEGFHPELIEATCARIEALSIPWAFCMGNHEGTHGPNGVRAQKAALMKAKSKHLLFDSGPKGIYGVGNYVISVKQNGKPAWLLYLLDSNDFAFYMVKGVPSRYHDAIRADQIEWFCQTAEAMRKKHGPLPSVAFCHVPVPEYTEAVLFETYKGDRFQRVTTAPLNTGFFAAALEKGVRALFVGHDHTNSFAADVLGMTLAYGRCSGYGCSAPPSFYRGGRVVLLSPQDGTVETYPLFHRPEGIGGQPAVFRPEEQIHHPPFDRFEFIPPEKLP